MRKVLIWGVAFLLVLSLAGLAQAAFPKGTWSGKIVFVNGDTPAGPALEADMTLVIAEVFKAQSFFTGRLMNGTITLLDPFTPTAGNFSGIVSSTTWTTATFSFVGQGVSGSATLSINTSTGVARLRGTLNRAGTPSSGSFSLNLMPEE
jgi:hypothetical protein